MRNLWICCFLVACGDNGGTADDGGAPKDGSSSSDSSFNDSNIDAPVSDSAPDVNGLVDLAIKVEDFSDGMMKTALVGASVRVESMQIGFLEANTDVMGIAHVMVDLAKGPFDITVGTAGYRAVSVLGVSGPGTSIVTEKNAVPSFTTRTANGSIGGKIAGGNTVQLDSFWFSTLGTKSGTYSTNFYTANASPPLPITALEINSQNVIVNAVQTMATQRPNMNTTINVLLPGNATGFTMATHTINFPNAGTVRGMGMTPGLSVGIVGNGTVVKRNANPRAIMYVGIADATAPVNDVSTVSVQSGVNAFKPDFFQVGFYSSMSTTMVLVGSSQFSNATTNIGQVNTLAVSGTTLDNATFSADTAGYDAIGLTMRASVMGTVNDCWTIWSAGAKLSAHGVPKLPSSVKLADVGCSGMLTGWASARKLENGSTAPWAETTKIVSVEVAKTITNVGPGTRP